MAAVGTVTGRGEQTRSRILEAAAELMFARGVARTSIDDVLAQSRTSKSQMYHYFADRDALIRAVIKYQAQRVLERQRTALDGVDSLDGLRRWREEVLAIARQTGGVGGCPVGSLAGQLGRADEMREVLAESFREWEAVLTDGLRRMQASGALRATVDPVDLATALMAAFQGGFLLAQSARSTRPLEVALDMALTHVERHTC